MNPDQKNKILEFLHKNPMAVISTIDHGSPFPESALIAFDQYDNFEIIFETFEIARKYKNLMANGHISLVVGWSTERHITLQYEGIVRPIATNKYESYIEHFLEKDTPCPEKFLRDNRVRLFKTTPVWLGYSDYTTEVPEVVEYTF